MLTSSQIDVYHMFTFSWFSANLWNTFQVAISPEFGVFQWDFSCLFRNRYSKCPQVSIFPTRSRPKISGRPRAEATTFERFGAKNLPVPVCQHTQLWQRHPIWSEFALILCLFNNSNISGERYWGSHYPRLTRIKAAWDPKNVFHHCHSVASTAQQCCPFWNPQGWGNVTNTILIILLFLMIWW